MSVVQVVRRRIDTKGIRSQDIYHNGLLSDDEIASIPCEKVYQWVKTGEWKQKHFLKWLKVMRVIE